MKVYKIPIEEALDWTISDGSSLRQSLVDEAEAKLEVSQEEGSMEVSISDGFFTVKFTPSK